MRGWSLVFGVLLAACGSEAARDTLLPDSAQDEVDAVEDALVEVDTRTPLPADKAEARAQAAAGTTDWAEDPCQLAGWYRDSECDLFCPLPDVDCAAPDVDVVDGDDGDIAAQVPLAERYLLPGDRLYPESVAFDPIGRAFFTSSLGEGTVLRTAADGTVTTFFAGTGEEHRVTLGIKVDSARGRLVVCSTLDVEVPTGRIWLFDLASGTRTHDIDLTNATPNGSCNDIAVDGDGSIYVTDRELPNIYRIDQITEANARVVVWATDPKLAKVLIGQNGIAFTPDHTALITTQYLPPQLFRVSFSDPTDVRAIDLAGTHPLSQLLSGADGALFVGESLYVAFGSALVKLTDDHVAGEPTWTAASYVALDISKKIAALTVAEGQLYALKSDVARFVLGGEPELPFEIVRVDPAALMPLP